MNSNECSDPNCGCHAHRKRIEAIKRANPFQDTCTQFKPLQMVIPPEGVHISCPVHGGHFVTGPSQVTL